MGLTVTVVSKSEEFDFSEWATGLVRYGEINATSVADMVHKVKLKPTAQDKIARLDLYAHGTSTYMTMGKDIIHSYTPNKHVPVLSGLKGLFTSDGIIVLNVCDVGQSPGVLKAIAKAAGVPVYGNTGGVSPNMGIFWGEMVVAYPDGRFFQGSGVRIPVDPWEGVQS